jgi:hypothetical protein
MVKSIKREKRGRKGMVNKKWLFGIGIVLLFFLLSGCGLGASSNKDVDKGNEEPPKQKKMAATFETLVSSKQQNNTVIVEYKTKNISDKMVKLTFPTGLKVDYIIYDEQGTKVKQYSDVVMATQAIVEVELQNGEEINQEFTISDLSNGKYVVELFLTAKEEEAKGALGAVDLLINNSPSTKGTGDLIGQMDPHTVEIMMNGVPTAFQLSEEAIDQLPLLNDGEGATFMYSTKALEGNIEQKTIEKFIFE